MRTKPGRSAYAGSEVTNILGQTEGGRETTVPDAKILPEIVIYDPMLTTGLPVAMSVTSGLNAMAHAVEGLHAEDRNPISSLMAVEGLKAFTASLPEIVRAPKDPEARSQALYRACSAARCSAQSVCRCITRSAMCWAAPSTYRVPKPMR